MLKILRIIFSIGSLSFAIYGLITGDFKFNYIMILFLGITMLLMGLEEFHKERKGYGWLFVAVFLLTIYTSVQGYLWQ
ncbi:DUF3953 domain-containing protein [Bacillus sp. BHET2]|uniref:DUF3953 domain-containing protein n=1 Tax=Bacillus sp. BHET2 TaxID=2583818 RepID=UPI00110E9F7F|nr:DUF3953 domain-containing protein [Bacillus sp. BHET2]TMU87237.1 DUF3953 domain-containing protein [Bacillus sp. BHET2]